MFSSHTPMDHLAHPFGDHCSREPSTLASRRLTCGKKTVSEMLRRLVKLKVSFFAQSRWQIKNMVQERGRGEEDYAGEDLGTWEKGNRTATCLQVVSQSSSRPPQHNPQSGHPCNNMAATGERDKEGQTNRREKDRKQRVSNRIGRYSHMLSLVSEL